MSVILAAQSWATNAGLMETARDLGYVTGRVLDPTYGKGNWWTRWRPDQIVTHDITIDGVDFRCLPDEGPFDTVAFDPPYIPQGGRATSTIDLDRYGLRDVPATNDDLRALIRDGMASFTTVLRDRGVLLVKCMSYVNGGAWRPMPRWIACDAEALGFRQVDELIYLRRPGPQPNHPRQLTARRNYSQLLVFRFNGPAVHRNQMSMFDTDHRTSIEETA